MEIGIAAVPNAYLYERKEDVTKNGEFTGIADEIFMGWAVGILEEYGTIVKVLTHYGYSGYMKKELLRKSDEEELRIREYEKNTFFVCRAFADVLDIPDVKGTIRYTLSRGSFVTIMLKGVSGGYWKVMLPDETTGYIAQPSLSFRLDSDAYLYTDKKDGYFLRQTVIKEVPSDILRGWLVNQACKYLGTQYRWGGKSGAGLDCSGLTFMCYQMSGILIYRDAKIQNEYPVKQISFEEAQKGDLLYFPGHIAIYLENGRYIHSTGNAASGGCVINSFNDRDADYRRDLANQLLYAGSIF